MGRFDTPRSARSIQVAGPYAYVGDLKWLRVIDVTNPSAPREIASRKTPGYTKEIIVVDGAAYVANYDAGLIIMGIEGQGSHCARGTSCEERVSLSLQKVVGQ